MNIIREMAVEEVIGVFLSAELHSSRFRAGSLKALKMLGYDETLIEKPDYSNYKDNKKRAKVLGLCRGWPDEGLFTNFPNNTNWFLSNLSQVELLKVLRLKSYPSMTNNERLLPKTVSKLKKGLLVKNVDPDVINQIATKIEAGVALPPIILVGQNIEGKKVLVEGHSRSIAYCYVGKQTTSKELPAIIGLSPHMTEWAYY
ncbi:MAG TPA: hypothetical protein VIH90_01565 [Candidatus Saccharimonadales bacterium]